MAKNITRFVCQSCGADYAKWSGKCESCHEWNSITEEAGSSNVPGGLAKKNIRKGKQIEFVSLEGSSKPLTRYVSNNAEFDRVCGGGLVPGSAVLIGGDPGIGKSTLLTQILASLATHAKARCVYISGEEAIDQVRLRARRLGLKADDFLLASATSVRDIATTLDEHNPPQVVVIDSIQTMFIDSLDSAPGTVSQVRASAQELIQLAKARGFCLLLVGHVTKEGVIAGPKVLEHMVDTVLTFEGERGHHFRILRAAKNRFGPTDEIGVFEMSEQGLEQVSNPSALFLAERRGNISGAAVFAGLEGTRPVLVEIQALVSPSQQANPRRAVVGWDSGRLAMILAVLEARCGLVLAGNEVYLNVAGGLRISEPAADMAVAAALISAAMDIPVPEKTVVFGEIGLSGEIRSVSQSESRLKEASKLGFEKAIIPPLRAKKNCNADASGLDTRQIEHLQDLVALFAAKTVRKAAGG
ncbi:DNA repair protein RadA [Kiloniella laminariae]|uniref:DNA repair protein RadA n=1 Tax=Kiloniella laminariae TaxID=454162 RepID=A0ABT4LH40_9PROT|nr:DNA repair protein RadA [Kiloniella laminariae]MCZ4280409.1 DNA repair protein RadA [Kiloniella laminariae]